MNDHPSVTADAFLGMLEALAVETDTLERWPIVRTGERPPIPRIVRHLVYRRDDAHCQMCGARKGPWEIDHIIPWSAGGADDTTNLRLLCKECNQRRSNFKTGAEFPAIPVTFACDLCIRRAHFHGLPRCRYYPACPVCGTAPPNADPIDIYCGCCREFRTVADERRLR
jgi:hypothetical protein